MAPLPTPTATHGSFTHIGVYPTQTVVATMKPGDRFTITQGTAGWVHLDFTHNNQRVTVMIDEDGVPALIAELQRLTFNNDDTPPHGIPRPTTTSPQPCGRCSDTERFIDQGRSVCATCGAERPIR